MSDHIHHGGHSDHHGHGDAHGHAHDPSLVSPTAFSLLRLSALQRLAGAGVLSGLVWLGVWWSVR